MRKSAIAIIALLASGCVYPQVEMPRQSFEEHIPAPQPRYENGSLWQENSVSLVDDFKARRRGDIVTVLIVEEASASKQANTGTKRETGISASIPNFMGVETTALADKLDLNALVKANTSSSYDGSGSTSRKDVLKATITARVTDVLPNGYLRIQGQRSVKVNNEEQIMILEGVVRPKDINHENMISSSQVADARITYAGNGIVNDKQQPGWLFNFVDKIWP
ncbi:MAG: flagellar basal body L-ring protein FlgH, partial [Geobacteraceae bacterium]|nr:flagellar basal body L-ring protein FlgH [Geobacteraceae bacterium]